MVWLIAFACLGLVGLAGYYQGPVRAAFSLFGLLFGVALADPLSPLTQHLLPALGLHHPLWQTFVPQALAFLIVVIIFKIAGQMVHRKIAVFFKYKVDDRKLLRWQRCYSRLGFCVGLVNGTVYFVLLMVPIYVAGYFTTEAASGAGDPPGARFLTDTRAELHALKLDGVLAGYDPLPRQVYKAADIADLVLHNPLLESRLAHYPPLLQLAEQPEFKSLAKDVALHEKIVTGAPIREIVQYPAVQTLLTNATVTSQVSDLMGKDLDDLQEYLNTGQSPKYDVEEILGVWDIDRAETVAQVRKKEPGLTPLKLGLRIKELFPKITGLSLTVMPDNHILLKRPDPNTAEYMILASGSWKKEGDTYQVNLPGLPPETSEIEIQNANRLFLPKFGCVLAFDKEM